jgi:CTP:molybdopterin cytidylyltransferase MocA
VLVVLGSDADRHRQVIADLQVDVQVNDEWQEGMASTLRRAVGLASECHAARCCCRAISIESRRRSSRSARSLAPVAIARVRVTVGRPHGPAVILPLEYYDEVLKLRGDTGARRCSINRRDRGA